ncbi:Integrin alpha-8 [Schistosoma japonicum]|nr:Integrin alpha-8 [Schistosoma japonicum]
MLKLQLFHLIIFLTCYTTFSLSTYRENKIFQEFLLYPPDSARRYTHTNRGSYFGYSVATYIGQSQPSCLVGAPRASHSGSGNSGTNESTGVVYRLDMDLTFPFCSVVPIATTDELRKEVGTPTPGISYWLGGTVAAANNAVDGIQLGCDFRYLFNSDLMSEMPNDLVSNSDDRYKSSIKSKSSLGIGNCALYTGTSMQYVSVDPCHSQEEGACLAGFSADVQAGNQSGEALVALGMPGSYLTEGNLFLGRYRGRELIHAIRLKSSSHDLKHKGFGLGYAIALAKLNNNNKRIGQQKQPQSDDQQNTQSNINIIASSPMWIDNDYRGIVMILNQAMDLGGITYLRDKWSHVGSYFGYSLAVADLDGNGLADIIVGAPYFTRHQSQETLDDSTSSKHYNQNEGTQWSNLLPDIGRVYVFYGNHLNSSSLLSESKQRPEIPDYFAQDPVILDGPQFPRGRFGHALTNIGDVDGDGTEDLAVSCPYCTDPNGETDKGAVFIYLGKKDSVLNTEPFQSIWPSDLPKQSPVTVCGSTDFTSDYVTDAPRQFTAFGWSLSGSTDLDGNYAPDLVIGDYESDQVVMLRGRNTLWFDLPQWDLPTQPTLSWQGKNTLTCNGRCSFPIHLSARINGNRQLLKEIKDWKLRLHVDLDSDVQQPEKKRLIIQSTRKRTNYSSIAPGLIDMLVELKADELTEGSKRITLFDFIVEPLTTKVSELLWKPLRINVTLNPVLDSMSFIEHTSITSWILHPFLGNRSFISRSMQFANPACGVDNICRPDLQIQMTDISEGPFDKSVIYFRERVSQRNITVSITNLGENAYSTQLHMIFPDQLSFSILEGLPCQTVTANELKQTKLICQLDDPLGYTGDDHMYKFTFQINTAGAFRLLDEPLNDQPENISEQDASQIFQQQQQHKNNHNNVYNDHRNDDIERVNSLSRITNKPNEMRTEFHRQTSSVWMETNKNYESNPKQTYNSYNQHFTKRSKRSSSTPLIPKDLTITAEVISGNTDYNMNNNKANITYRLKLAAKVELSSSALDRTVIDFRNFSVQPYEMQRIHPETIGPELKHVYLVTNDGPSPVESFWVNLTIPIQTRDGEHLVYLLDRLRYQAEDGGPPRFENISPDVVSAEGHVRGQCVTPEWALNPLRLNAVHRGRVDKFSRSQSLSRSFRSKLLKERYRRNVKRKNEKTTLSSTNDYDYLIDNQSVQSKDTIRNTRSILHGIRKRQQEIIKCGEKVSDLGYPVCAVISCHVNGLSRGDAVRIILRGWIWADTFFRYKISDFAIVSEANAKLEQISFGIKLDSNLTIQPLAISQNFVFEGINVSLFREIPLWPFILGSILGLALLALLIFTMWRCGFFHRKQIYDNHLQPYPHENNNVVNNGNSINPIFIEPRKI